MGRGVLLFSGMTLGGKRIQRDLWESKAQALRRVGKDRQRRADAGLMEGGTHKAKGSHPPFMGEEDVERRETRPRGQNWKGGSPEAVGHPSLDLPPMNIHLGEKPFGGYEEVSAIG